MEEDKTRGREKSSSKNAVDDNGRLDGGQGK